MKTIFDLAFLTALYVGGVFTLDPDTETVAMNVGASVAGAAVLAYFKRDRDYKEIFFKSMCAAVCGLVIGAVLTKRYEITSHSYIVATYFFSSLLSIFIIKGLLAFAEQNAAAFVVSIFQRFMPNGRMPSIDPGQHKTEQPVVIETDIVVQRDGEIIETTKPKKEGK